jgi:uncharacterized protein (DUF488 family)
MRIYSVGHSSHRLDRFLALLARHGIQTVVDVRSVPYSRRLPQFQRDPLRAALLEAGLRYQFLGRELGGMPREPKLLDETGQVDYRRVGQTERFRRGI